MDLKIKNQILEIISVQNNFRSVLENNEAQTRWLLIDPLVLNIWNYSRKDIIVEYYIDTVDRLSSYDRLDYVILLENRPKIIIEAKRIGKSLKDNFVQLQGYFEYILQQYQYEQGELIGVLTDGDIYWFYSNLDNKNKLDDVPFSQIVLSQIDFESGEYLKLLDFSKENIKKSSNNIIMEDRYELKEPYRIDMISDVFDSFESRGIQVSVKNIYFQGKKINIRSFTQLYKRLIQLIDGLNPNLIYNLAVEEDSDVNKRIVLSKFSLSQITLKDYVYKTEQGFVYISIPDSRSDIINRIVYILEKGNLSTGNVLISLGEKLC